MEKAETSYITTTKSISLRLTCNLGVQAVLGKVCIKVIKSYIAINRYISPLLCILKTAVFRYLKKACQINCLFLSLASKKKSMC